MAYVISPYAQPAILPRDNTGVQLVSEIAKAGYARRMKEMENKMKLEEEGRKAFDEAYKYANLDLSKVDPIYHDELKRQADALAKGMIEAYKQNPASFKYNTAIADEARRLSTIKTQREAQSADIQKSMDARRQLEKEGKFDVAFNELGQAYSAWQNATDPAEKAKKQQEFIERYTSGDLNIATPKVEDYTWAGNVAKEAKDLIQSQQGRKLDYTQRKTFEDVIMNDERKKSSLAKQIGLDSSTPEGEQELRKRIQSYLPSGEKPAPQGGGYGLGYASSITNPTPGRVDFGMTTEKQGGGTMTAQSSVTSPAQITFSTAMPTTLVQPSVSYGLENGKTLNNDADFKDNKLFEVALSKVALLPVYKKGVTRKGGVDVSGEIVDDLNLNDERLNGKYEYKVFAIGQGTKEIGEDSRDKQLITKDLYIPINQVKDAVWDKLAQSEKQSVMKNIFDMKELARDYNSKLKSPSSEKPAAEKPKGEYKITMQYKGATYGRNSEKDQWVKIK
jgi:hypothetical protein